MAKLAKKNLGKSGINSPMVTTVVIEALKELRN